MQFMEQIRHVPAPAMGFAWSSPIVGKSVFVLITLFCILMGLVGGREDAPIKLSMNQTGAMVADPSRWPIEVALLAPTANSQRSSVAGIPVPTGERPLDVANRVSIGQSGQSIGRTVTYAVNGTKAPNPKSPAAMRENASERLTFSGRVVGGDGMPVGDAKILYSAKYKPPESVTRSAADGMFRFESPRLELNEWEHVSIIATHPDYALGWQNLQLQNTANIEIRLETPGVISGKTLNGDSTPIQNASIEIQVLFSGNPDPIGRESNLAMDVIPISPVKTDAHGEFVLGALPRGAAVNLKIQAPGSAKQTHHRILVGTEEIEFRLKREARIEGRLSYAETGAPVESSTVALAGIHPTEGWEQTGVDANGNFYFENLPSGAYSLYLEKGPEGWTAASNEFIKLVEGQTVSDINLTLVRGGFITGRVTDRDTNEPIANHEVVFSDAARPELQATGLQPFGHGAKTDETGTYRFRAAPGRALVLASAPQAYLNLGPIKRYVDVVEEESVTVDFEFSKGVELTGKVLTQAGDPVTGAWILAQGGNLRDYGKSDELGKFTVRGLRVGQKLSLKAEQTDIRLRGRAEVEVQPETPVEIQMTPYERVEVSGRVVSAEGEPIPSVNIELIHWDPLQNTGVGSTIDATSGDGRFGQIGLIVGDRYSVSASAEGYRSAETDMFTAMAEMTQIADLILLPIDGQFFIEGRITDTTGQPVHGALLFIEDPEFRETLTDADGHYRFENLYTTVVSEVDIDHHDYAHHQFKDLKTNQRHDLLLVKADGYITGKVVDADGNPIEQAIVTVETEKDSSGYVYMGVLANVLGEFELKHIKDLSVSISVTDNRNYNHKIFENIAVNQRGLVLTLTAD